MKTLLVVAPHADDETLGCGGTLLKYKAQGVKLGWLIVTSPTKEAGYSEQFVQSRAKEIKKVQELYGFSYVKELNLQPGGVEEKSKKELVYELSQVIANFQPSIVLLPFEEDVHSDHQIIFNACQSALKTFRAPDVESILCYETLSESDQGFQQSFSPNVFINISDFLQEKIDILEIYESEMAAFPFPRSEKAIVALAHLRGAQSGFFAAEAFMLMKERIL